jgi:N utilization substance protein B
MSSRQGRSRARRAAVQALYQWQCTGQTPAEIAGQFREGPSLERADQDYFDALLAGVVRDRDHLESAIARFIDRPVGQLDPVARAILLLGAFELDQRAEVPWRVVVNEAVDLAHTFGADKSHRYVNGVLDRVARDLRPEECARP